MCVIGWKRCFTKCVKLMLCHMKLDNNSELLSNGSKCGKEKSWIISYRVGLILWLILYESNIDFLRISRQLQVCWVSTADRNDIFLKETFDWFTVDLQVCFASNESQRRLNRQQRANVLKLELRRPSWRWSGNATSECLKSKVSIPNRANEAGEPTGMPRKRTW